MAELRRGEGRGDEARDGEARRDLGAGEDFAEPERDGDPAPVGRLVRSVALVGLMGSGKSAVGRRLARALDAPFVDSDDEIVQAAGMEIPEIFERYGEPHFRDRERKVVARLVDGPPSVIATGGGAFVNAETRALLKARAHTIWIRADLDVLVARCGRRDDRPLLVGRDPREVLEALLRARGPLYAEADSAIDSGDGPHEAVVRAAIDVLAAAGAVAERRSEAPLGSGAAP